MLVASKLEDGRYRLADAATNRWSETYARRAEIKRLGGTWDGFQWTIPAEAVDQIGAQRLYAVIRAAFCHEPSAFNTATRPEVDAGKFRAAFCSYCDSHSNDHPAIVEVLGEGCDGLAEWRRRKAAGLV